MIFLELYLIVSKKLALTSSLLFYGNMTRPRSTAELSEQITVQVEHNVPIRLYFRSADLLLRQARVYKLENDLEHAFSLYMKYTM